jgi:glycosyltransferase involved in cell wall biosynthesis
MSNDISVCIIAGNEERKIRRCLESVTWASEIVVVDSLSTDNTVAICKEYTDRVYTHEWLGYIGQKNLIKDMAVGPWIFFVDADEEVSAELKDEILSQMEAEDLDQYVGFEFPRMVRFLGRWITHGDWYPDVKLRLFLKDSGISAGVEPHDKVEVDGKVKRLRNHLYHYTYDSIQDQVIAINKFSTITARGWHERGRPFRLRHIIFRPVLRFIRTYILRGGFLDGLPGLVVAATTSYGVFVKYAKLWQFNRETRDDSNQALSEKGPSIEKN